METIICGIDGSPGGRAALRTAAEVAQRLPARLLAVHVQTGSSREGDASLRTAASLVAEEVPESGTEARGASGDVAERLAAAAEAEHAIMIVVGARRRGRSRAFLRTRSAVSLVGLTDIPVIVAPLPPNPTPAPNNSAPRTDMTDEPRRLSAVPPEVAPDIDRPDAGTATGRVRPAGAVVAEQRRLRRKERLHLRPAWSRGNTQGGRPHD